MARITVEDCLEQIGDHNRFNLIKLAVKRIKQHRHGEPYLVEGKNKEVVMTLREIATGDVSFDNVDQLPDLDDRDKGEDKESADENKVAASV